MGARPENGRVLGVITISNSTLEYPAGHLWPAPRSELVN